MTWHLLDAEFEEPVAIVTLRNNISDEIEELRYTMDPMPANATQAQRNQAHKAFFSSVKKEVGAILDARNRYSKDRVNIRSSIE